MSDNIIKDLLDRVSLLELELKSKRFKEEMDKTENFMKCLSNHDEKIHDLENICAEKRLIQIENHLLKLQKDFESKLDIDYEKWVQYFNAIYPKRKPHKCPICEGKGYYFPGPLYKEDCIACETKGIVWG